MSKDLRAVFEHWEAGRLQEAEAGFRALLQARALAPGARGMLAMLLLEAGREGEAESEALAAVEEKGEIGAGNDALSRIYLRRKQYAEAAREAKRAIELDGRSPDTMATLSIAYDGMGEHDRAKTVVEEGLKEWPGHPLLLNASIGNRLLRRIGAGNPPENADEAVETPEGWIHRGRERREAGDVAGALAAFREALRVEPGHAEARREIAQLAATGGSPWRVLIRAALRFRSIDPTKASYFLVAVFLLERFVLKGRVPPPVPGFGWYLPVAFVFLLAPTAALFLLFCDRRGIHSLSASEKLAAPVGALLVAGGLALLSSVYAVRWVPGVRLGLDLLMLPLSLAAWASSSGWSRKVLGAILALCLGSAAFLSWAEFRWPGKLSDRPVPVRTVTWVLIVGSIAAPVLSRTIEAAARKRVLP